MKITNQELISLAKDARKYAYAPYSDFFVGAALLCSDGTVYTGCNIENASFTPTCCAERVAIFKAVSDGEQDFLAIAVSGGKHGEKSADKFVPCGVCRQVMREFCGDDFRIILDCDGGEAVYTLGELLPESFGKEKL